MPARGCATRRVDARRDARPAVPPPCCGLPPYVEQLLERSDGGVADALVLDLLKPEIDAFEAGLKVLDIGARVAVWGDALIQLERALVILFGALDLVLFLRHVAHAA